MQVCSQGVLRQGRRCVQCGELLNESQEHGWGWWHHHRIIMPCFVVGWRSALRVDLRPVPLYIYSFLGGCRCYTPIIESVVQMGEKGNERFKKPHWTDGRLGDIDFTGSSRTRGKVHEDRYLPYHSLKLQSFLMRDYTHYTHSLFVSSVRQGHRHYRSSRNLSDYDQAVGSRPSAPGGGTSGWWWGGSDEALDEGHG